MPFLSRVHKYTEQLFFKNFFITSELLCTKLNDKFKYLQIHTAGWRPCTVTLLICVWARLWQYDHALSSSTYHTGQLLLWRSTCPVTFTQWTAVQTCNAAHGRQESSTFIKSISILFWAASHWYNTHIQPVHTPDYFSYSRSYQGCFWYNAAHYWNGLSASLFINKWTVTVQ